MGTTPVLLRNANDIYVTSRYPSTNTGTTWKYLHASADSGSPLYMESYIYFGLPFPRGVTIISAKLRLVQHPNFSGSHTVNVARVAATWSTTRVTYNTKPASTGTVVTVAKTGSTAGTTWEWDVTALMQTVSNGAAWYGFRLYGTNVTAYPTRFYSSSADNILQRPVLEVSWKDNPQKPTQMHPSDGRVISGSKPIVQCDFTDYSGDTSMAAIEVHTFTSEANAIANTPIEFDSGEVAATEPELDLSTTAITAITDGATKWWRVRVKDGAGLWSSWSDPTSFTRNTKGTLTITNPSSNQISDATPPITWTFSGRTQRAYQVIVTKTVTVSGTMSYTRQVWTSGKITSTATTLTIPSGVITSSDNTYTIYVRIWDTLDRESIAGDPAYQEASTAVSWVYSSVTPTTNLAATTDNYCHVTLTWNRGSLPDKYDIYRGSKIIASVPGSDLFVSGTSYQYIDRSPTPRAQTTYKVVPIVNNVGSSTSQTVNITPTPKTLILSDDDGSNPVLIFDNQHELALAKVSAVFMPAGDGKPVLLTQSTHGYIGKVQGTIQSNPLVTTLSSQQWRDRLVKLTENEGEILHLILIDRGFKCFVNNVVIKPNANNSGVFYEVSFDFYQTDYEA